MSRQIEKPETILYRLSRISLLVYPLVAHSAIMLDKAIWATSYLLAIVCFYSLMESYRYQGKSRIIFVLLCFLMVIFLYAFNFNVWAIYIPPVLIPAWLAFVFISSLYSEEGAVISRMAERIERKTLDQQQIAYTRRITAIWAIMFVLMICEAIVLALWASFEVWSWWVHIGNYILIASLFLAEILFRFTFLERRPQVFRMLKTLLQRKWHE